MIIFTTVMLWIMFGGVTTWAYICMYMCNEHSVDKFLRGKKMKLSSLPAVFILIGLIWPITLSALALLFIYNVGNFIYSTFKSLYLDVKNIVKGEK